MIGWNNDMTILVANDRLDIQRVNCPVLLVHSDPDTSVMLDLIADECL